MKEPYHVIWEFVLILSSVLIFRSIWHLIDIHLENNYLVEMLILGCIGASISIYILNRHTETLYRPLARKKHLVIGLRTSSLDDRYSTRILPHNLWIPL